MGQDTPETIAEPTTRAVLPRGIGLVRRAPCERVPIGLGDVGCYAGDGDQLPRGRNGKGITGKTWNDELKLLRATFKHLRREAALTDNPFEKIPLKDADVVFRKPFTPDELKRVLDAASDDSFTRPLIVTAMCTAMRKGDCCRLKWADVGMRNRFVTVKTTKTGVTVTIPMFALMHDLLCDTANTESPYCFPKQAKMYESNPEA
jgi:integrase